MYQRRLKADDMGFFDEAMMLLERSILFDGNLVALSR